MKCAQLLGSTSVLLEGPTSGKIVLKESPRVVFPIAVVADHYPALAFQARQFLKVETPEGIAAPLVTDVFALDSITEMLRTPLRFLSYIGFRARYSAKLTASHENMLLSYHLRRNLWLEPDIGMLWLQDDISGDLDAAMYVRREGLPGADTPDGILTRFKGTLFERIIRDIEDVPEQTALSLGLMLLELSEEAVKALDGFATEILKRTVADGGLHDASVYMATASVGLTVHSRKEWTPEGAQRLLSHCGLRKYVQRAERWFGVALRQDGALAFVAEVGGEWKRNPGLEKILETVPLKPAVEIGNPTGAGSEKVGRR